MTRINVAPVLYPGARLPDRQRIVTAYGLRLMVYEWGEADALPLLLAHGSYDFARTFDVFAPLLADAGYRVISWDQRGHGDSEHAALYSFQADVRDLLAVADSVSPGPFPVVGHSKGGSLLVHAIQALPYRFSRCVSIDGLPFRTPPETVNLERSPNLREQARTWLHDRRRAHSVGRRRPGSPGELAKRRGKLNPRLDPAWLEYIVYAGAREAADGWRWKLDPCLQMSGLGPWQSRWVTGRLPGFPVPLLGLLGTEQEPMGWGVDPDLLRRYLPPHSRIQVLEETGHFIHIERPEETAARVLEFLADE